MEQILLGLLVLQSMTIYELNSFFKRSVSLFYSPSYGSLQRALGKLVARGALTVTEELDGKRRRKRYSITQIGGTEFYQWMREAIPERKMTKTILSKLYFLGLIKKKRDKISIVESWLKALTTSEESLTVAEKSMRNIQPPKPLRDLFEYQHQTLEYGLQSSRFTITWFKELLRDLKE